MGNPSPTPPLTTRAQFRLAEIRSEISGRLWHVSTGMSSAAFNELMDQMSQLQLNCELREAADNAGSDGAASHPYENPGRLSR